MNHVWCLCLLVFVHLSNQIDLQPNLGAVGGNENCTCIPYYLCKDGIIITNGEGVIDIRKNGGPCNNYLLRCCKKEDQSPVPLTTHIALKPSKGCGYRQPNGVGFKITGDEENESQFGEFPWMVAVLGNDQYQCGGALIHPSVVITAGHCVTNKEKTFSIRAGEWDTQHIIEPFPHQEKDVTTVIIHPDYYSGALYNDIALLLLAEPVSITDNVDTICLPPQNATIDVGLCYANGWGKDVFGKKGKNRAILKKIDLPQVPRDTCQELLRETRLSKFFNLHESFMCAGGEAGKDTCLGDGGGPLVCPIEGQANRYFQAGIVSWGIGCGSAGVPGVYANVALFRNWIDGQMKANNFDTSVYQF